MIKLLALLGGASTIDLSRHHRHHHHHDHSLVQLGKRSHKSKDVESMVSALSQSSDEMEKLIQTNVDLHLDERQDSKHKKLAHK